MAPSCKLRFARFSAGLKFQDGAECGNISHLMSFLNLGNLLKFFVQVKVGLMPDLVQAGCEGEVTLKLAGVIIKQSVRIVMCKRPIICFGVFYGSLDNKE